MPPSSRSTTWTSSWIRTRGRAKRTRAADDARHRADDGVRQSRSLPPLQRMHESLQGRHPDRRHPALRSYARDYGEGIAPDRSTRNWTNRRTRASRAAPACPTARKGCRFPTSLPARIRFSGENDRGLRLEHVTLRAAKSLALLLMFRFAQHDSEPLPPARRYRG